VARYRLPNLTLEPSTACHGLQESQLASPLPAGGMLISYAPGMGCWVMRQCL
jgi:hypothetical protein